MTLEADIARMVLEDASEHAIRDFIETRLERRSGSLMHAEGIDIETMKYAASEAENAMYAWLRSLSISAAPEVIATHRFGDSCLVVRRYWACPGERLLKLSGSDLKLHEEARRRFAADMQRMFEQGKLYPYIRGDAHWLVSEKTGVIVLSPWLLIDAVPKKWEEHFGAIERTFTRYS